jgi:hypothetical protein
MTNEPQGTVQTDGHNLVAGNGAAVSELCSDAEHSRKRRATGPRTTHGKERSKHNALKHGIFSKVILLKDERRTEFEALLNGLREDLQPEGELEAMLVEKLAVIAWRERRLMIAETAEIQKAIEFLSWDEEQRITDHADNLTDFSIRYEGGLFEKIANPKVLDKSLELLKELREGIEDEGFDPNWDTDILAKLYGEAPRKRWQQTLFDSYRTWSATAECTEEERKEHGYAAPEKCKEIFLAELAGEIKRLERLKKARASIESERMKLDALRQRVPLTPQFDHLLRYEASLERNFDRTLTQLERLQRMRLGQPVLPKLEVQHSLA